VQEGIGWSKVKKVNRRERGKRREEYCNWSRDTGTGRVGIVFS